MSTLKKAPDSKHRVNPLNLPFGAMIQSSHLSSLKLTKKDSLQQCPEVIPGTQSNARLLDLFIATGSVCTTKNGLFGSST